MPIARTLLERALLLVLAAARSAFVLQGIAMLAATFVASSILQPASVPWFDAAVRSTQATSGVLLVAGLLLVASARLKAPRTEPGVRAEGSWTALLGLTLVVLPVLAWIRTADLRLLWGEIAALFDEIGVWDAFARGADPFAGLVLFPVLAATLVPALETAAAFFLVAGPPVMLALAWMRSPLVPRTFAMLCICQVALVAASVIASHAFALLAAEAVAAMSTPDDLEVQRLAEILGRAQQVLSTTAAALVLPAAGHLAWLPFLLRSSRVGAYFAPEAAAGDRPAGA